MALCSPVTYESLFPFRLTQSPFICDQTKRLSYLKMCYVLKYRCELHESIKENLIYILKQKECRTPKQPQKWNKVHRLFNVIWRKHNWFVGCYVYLNAVNMWMVFTWQVRICCISVHKIGMYTFISSISTQPDLSIWTSLFRHY